MPLDAPIADLLAARHGAGAHAAIRGSAVLEAVLARRSVRACRPDPLPAGPPGTAAAAAESAPTSSDRRTWSVVAVEDGSRPAAVEPRPPLPAVLSREACGAAGEAAAVASHDAALTAFRRGEGLPEEGWSRHPVDRVRTAARLSGRHRTRGWLGALGSPTA